jgi:hypothetical protein
MRLIYWDEDAMLKKSNWASVINLPVFAMVNTGMDFMINARLAFTKK